MYVPAMVTQSRTWDSYKAVNSDGMPVLDWARGI